MRTTEQVDGLFRGSKWNLPALNSSDIRRILVRYALIFCSCLPLPVSHALGVMVGWGCLLIRNRTLRDTRTNIGLCLPELSRADQRRLVRRSLAETGKTLMETGALWMRREQDALRLIRHIHGLDVALSAREAGHGVIFATPHLGAWEAAGLYCAHAFHMTCLFRPLRMTELDGLVRAARSRFGASYVPANAQGIRALRRAAGRGGAVAMLPDQEPRSGSGCFAPFFGVPAYSMTLLVRLSLSTGAPIVFTYCERLARGRGYRLHFRPAPQDIYSADTGRAVAAMNRAVEGLIRECPAQYQWSYRRFARRPGSERSVYG
jgi:KDO2-lipid IV(A) lauroyltransferase